MWIIPKMTVTDERGLTLEITREVLKIFDQHYVIDW